MRCGRARRAGCTRCALSFISAILICSSGLTMPANRSLLLPPGWCACHAAPCNDLMPCCTAAVMIICPAAQHPCSQVMAAMARPVRLTRGKQIDAAWTVDEVGVLTTALTAAVSAGQRHANSMPCCAQLHTCLTNELVPSASLPQARFEQDEERALYAACQQAAAQVRAGH